MRYLLCYLLCCCGLHKWVADERLVGVSLLSQTAQLQRQMQLAESELSRMAEVQAEAGQHVAALQAELAAAHDQAAAAGSALEAAARDASQARCLAGCAGVACSLLQKSVRVAQHGTKRQQQPVRLEL